MSRRDTAIVLGVGPPQSSSEGLNAQGAGQTKYFVSNAEADCFRVLRKVVGERGHVLSQVSLRQLVWFPGNNQSNPGRQTWHNRVAAKSVDFVVCDPATLWPKLVIELDELSHGRPERQTRD